VYVGGSELNVAVGAARLGLDTAWVSRLPDNALGRMIVNHARAQNVDVSRVVWTGEDRAGLYFVELGSAPRASAAFYDRVGSAFCRITPGTIDWTAALEGARWFHASGITPALSESAAATLAEALTAARKAGLTVSYDLNFRGKLWSADKARAVQEPLMRNVDVLIASEETARLVFGTSEAEQLHKRFGVKAIAMTVRGHERVWLDSWSAHINVDGATHRAPFYQVEVVDAIGAGDAFVAGLIYGQLKHESWDAAVRYGTALAALKHTVPGDFSQATLAEVEQLLKGTNLRVSR
jgi:2-dehydro-3-deoxygluconokinase